MRINLALSRSIALLAIAGAAVAFGQTRLYPDTSLFRVPAVTYLDASGAYRRIVYDVAPYKGRMASAFAFLSMPASSGGKVPGIVMVNGMCSPADSMETQRWASMGYAAISVDLTGTRPEVPYACACDVRVSGFDAINVHDEYRYQAAATIVRAVSLLRSLPGVDSTKVGIGGESWGSYNTMTAAGADPRIAFAVMYHGCGFLCDQPFFVQNNGACSDTFRLVVDPGNYIANCYCPTLWFMTLPLV
jgi:cephalosporin-C deacetylase-like acetyl esterase